MVAKINRFCFASSWRISHFGKKPERGGSPPKERRVSSVIIDRRGDLVVDEAMELILVELKVLNRRKVVSVKRIYKIRLRRVKLGV